MLRRRRKKSVKYVKFSHNTHTHIHTSIYTYISFYIQYVYESTCEKKKERSCIQKIHRATQNMKKKRKKQHSSFCSVVKKWEKTITNKNCVYLREEVLCESAKKKFWGVVKRRWWWWVALMVVGDWLFYVLRIWFRLCKVFVVIIVVFVNSPLCSLQHFRDANFFRIKNREKKQTLLFICLQTVNICPHRKK